MAQNAGSKRKIAGAFSGSLKGGNYGFAKKFISQDGRRGC
jgi:hypothetical protein